jgi:DNA-binding MarR family transcriptional regulator
MVAALMTVMSGLERARRHGDASTLAALQIVAARGPVRPSDIAAELGVHQSTVTRQVRALEAAGHVAVNADPDDRRSCFITLTDAGRGEIDRLTEIGLSRFALFVDDWEPEDVRTLGRLLTKLEHAKAAVGQREPRSDGRHWQKKR